MEVQAQQDAFVYLVKGHKGKGWWVHACVPGRFSDAEVRQMIERFRDELDSDHVQAEKIGRFWGTEGWHKALFSVLVGDSTAAGELHLHPQTAKALVREAQRLGRLAHDAV